MHFFTITPKVLLHRARYMPSTQCAVTCNDASLTSSKRQVNHVKRRNSDGQSKSPITSRMTNLTGFTMAKMRVWTRWFRAEREDYANETRSTNGKCKIHSSIDIHGFDHLCSSRRNDIIINVDQVRLSGLCIGLSPSP